MRFATYNVEWFAGLFDKDNQLIEDNSWSGRHDVTKSKQIKALGDVFQALDADAVMVIEAPDTSGNKTTTRSLENFATHFGLRTTKALSGFSNTTQQEIALLYDPSKMTAAHVPMGQETTEAGSSEAPRFDGVFNLDLNTDASPDKIRFSKPPLEVDLKIKSGPNLRLIGVHAKSKAPHGAKTRAEEVRISIDNRRKQLAQCIWLRQRVDAHLDAGDKLMVLGDFNDGPGLDEYEKLFGQSGIEIVLGNTLDPSRRLTDPHADQALYSRFGARPTTARFFNHKSKTYLNALLDYIMVSKNIAVKAKPVWKIWHPFDDPSCFDNADIQKSLLLASDHFPVSIDLDFG